MQQISTLLFKPWRDSTWSDIHIHSNGNAAVDFMNDVVNPSFFTVKNKLNRLQSSDNVLDIFFVSDAQILLGATTTAFCLSLQSIWERQLRKYLSACAHEMKLSSEVAALAESNKWPKVLELFEITKGFPISYFEAYEELELLHELGSICRHGEGIASKKLLVKRPNFWNSEHRSFSDSSAASPPHVSSGSPFIYLQRLQIFTNAIESFWDECVYLYNESIFPKHESLEAKLETERSSRAKRRLARGLPLWIKTS